MRYGFITCVRLGEACIEELIALDANLVYLGSLSDDRSPQKSGRVYLSDLAQRHDILLHLFDDINHQDTVRQLLEADLDWLFIIGWSQIARRPVLDAARRGTLGMHPTLLPRGRGRAAIPWAIIKGLDETGVSMFKLDEGMDTGPLLARERIPIADDETSATLYEKMVDAHRTLTRQAFPMLEAGDPTFEEQNESAATVWPGRRPADGKLEPAAMTSEEVDRHVRALTHPYPGAFVSNADGSVLRIWSGHVTNASACSCGGVVLSTRDGHYCARVADREAH